MNRLMVLTIASMIVVSTAKPIRAQQSNASDLDPIRLSAARDLVAKMTDRQMMLKSMSGPLAQIAGQMGVTDPNRAQTLVNGVILPVLSEHISELTDLQAQSYAAIFSADELHGVSAFYSSPVGKTWAAAQPRLAQAEMASSGQWLKNIAPELHDKLLQSIKQHGWAQPAPK